MRSNNELQGVSRGHSTGKKNPGRTEQSLVPSKRTKEVNTMKAEYPNGRSCPQKDSAEHEEYAGAQSVGCQEVAEQDGADLLEKILHRDNLNRAASAPRQESFVCPDL